MIRILRATYTHIKQRSSVKRPRSRYLNCTP
uniref:Uncharacterized protein n=1 Tax=Anguilla anguilla TaxID=7936 RepID=A0A0E9PKM0_ANGAN